MDWILVLEQCLNGLQFGLMLFLLAAGLTLVFGIMDMINLAHGSLYMIGAYLAATLVSATGSFWVGVALAAGRHCGHRYAAGSVGIAHSVSARSPVPGAGHLCTAADRQ